MADPWLLVVLLGGVIALTPLADVIRVPQPVLLTIFGIAAGFLPFAEPLELDPELILPVVLPPLLFAATQRTSSTEFKEHASAVLALAVGLTVGTAAVVAVAAHATGLAWSAAWVLGAIVSPPDPVAATAVARRLRLPHRLVTILEGEGMFNDATALVLYKVALAVAVTGSFSAFDTGWQFILTVVLGVVVGFVIGFIARQLLALIHEGYTETTITIVAPFLGYVLAEKVEGSGVLAVLVLGLYLRNVGHEATTSRGWLLGRSVWAYTDFLIASMAFAVLGFELVTVIGDASVSSQTVRLAAVVIAVVVAVRALYIFPVTALWRALARRRDTPMPANWREATVVSWSGMRGVVTVATALALPRVVESGGRFTDREQLVVTALLCVMATLVVQGLTLAPLTHRLGVGRSDDGSSELAALRRRAARAALDYVEHDADTGRKPEVKRAVMLQYQGLLAAQDAIDEAREVEQEEGDPSAELEALLRRTTDVERTLVLRARRQGDVSAETADAVLREIEGRALRDLG